LYSICSQSRVILPGILKVLYSIYSQSRVILSSVLILHSLSTGWRRLIASPKLQITFHKRATKYRSLLRKMTYKDKGSYESSPPCSEQFTLKVEVYFRVCSKYYTQSIILNLLSKQSYALGYTQSRLSSEQSTLRVELFSRVYSTCEFNLLSK